MLVLCLRTFNDYLLPISRFHNGLILLCLFHFLLLLMQIFTLSRPHSLHSHFCTFAHANGSQSRWQQSGWGKRLCVPQLCASMLSCTQLSATLQTAACQVPLWDFLGKNNGVGCHALLQGIFLTRGSNPHLLWLLHCRQILYCWATREALSHRVVQSKHPTGQNSSYFQIFCIIIQSG